MTPQSVAWLIMVAIMALSSISAATDHAYPSAAGYFLAMCLAAWFCMFDNQVPPNEKTN